MSIEDFDGDGDNDSPKVRDGTGFVATVYYNSLSVEFQSSVVISYNSVAGPAIDNRGNQLVSIEDLQLSYLDDHVEIDYSLATNPGISSASGREFLISIHLEAGDDYLFIGDRLPALSNTSQYFGAEVHGWLGNDTIIAGIMDDLIDGGKGDDVIKGGGGNDIISGSLGDDQIYGGDGDDTITPDDGDLSNDLVVGGKGRDTITLNDIGGFDRIRFLSVSDSTVKKHDSILYMEVGTDIIDLKAIDANTKTDRNDAFKIVNELTGKAGQLAYDVNNPSSSFPQWIFEGDVNGDGKVDFEVVVIKPEDDGGHKLKEWFDL